jgi:hypothetical protein
MRASFLLRVLGLGLLSSALSALHLAQEAGASPPVAKGAVAVRGASYGLAELDGELLGIGPDYRARFHPGSFELTPAFGSAIPRALPLTFEFVEARRASGTLVAIANGAAPERDPSDDEGSHTSSDATVAFAHAGIVERYQVLRDGLHHTFVLPARPEGSGDLIVRQSFRSELVPHANAQSGGIDFVAPGVGAITYGGLTGVDAAGRSAQGEVRLDDGMFELVLPAAFVDGASYPLVLDPLIGFKFEIDPASMWDDGDPDVAYGAGSSRWLVVWERRFALNDVDVRAQRLMSDGTPVGGVTAIASPAAGTVAVAPSVAYVRSTNRMLVVWQQTSLLTSEIVARTVDPSTGATSATLTLASNAARPDVGGERTLADDDAMVVWEDLAGVIRYRQVTVPAAGAPIGFATNLLIDPAVGTAVNPAISKSAGEFGNFLVAWQLESASGTGAIYARLMNRDGFLQGAAPSSLSFVPFDALDHRLPDVDGDGRQFIVAWQRTESLGSSHTDIYLRPVAYIGGNLVLHGLSPVALETLPGIDTRDVAVSFSGEQTVIAFSRLDDPTDDEDVMLMTVDPNNGKQNGTQLTALTHPEDEDARAPAIASMYAGGSSSDHLLPVWELRAADGDLYAWLFESPDATTDLGGACGLGVSGPGGDLYAPCFSPGNAQFNTHLRDAAPSVPALLVISSGALPFACGPCVIHPNVGVPHFIYARTTDLYGRASVQINVPIPLAAGTQFTAQWCVFSGVTCPLIGADLSNAQRLTVQ